MIEIKNVSMDFSESTRSLTQPSLKKVSLTIPEGCIYGFLGSNGAGKSTLMRLMSGIYPPTEGIITIDGESVYDNPAAKEKIFFVNDETTQFTGYTPDDLRLFYKGAYPEFSDSEFESIMKAVELPLDKKLATFSKGMKRQTVIALGLAANTKYLLFDEAFDGLDPAMRRMIKNIITDHLIDRSASLVVSSHNLGEIGELCDSAMLIHKGELVFSDDLDSLRGGFTKLQLVVRNTELADDSVLREKLSSLGLEVLDVASMGSIRQIIVKAGEQEALDKVSSLTPDVAEAVPLTLEEIFIYELEARGYGSADFLK